MCSCQCRQNHSAPVQRIVARFPHTRPTTKNVDFVHQWVGRATTIHQRSCNQARSSYYCSGKQEHLSAQTPGMMTAQMKHQLSWICCRNSPKLVVHIHCSPSVLIDFQSGTRGQVLDPSLDVALHGKNITARFDAAARQLRKSIDRRVGTHVLVSFRMFGWPLDLVFLCVCKCVTSDLRPCHIGQFWLDVMDAG